MKSNQFPIILFDWGNTVMIDDPDSTIPMVEWDSVETVPGIDSILAYLQSSRRRIVLATSASISDEAQIWGALARGRLDGYFSRIFCFKNTGLPKGERFYQFVLEQLEVEAPDALMVGDGFEKDVLDPISLGIYTMWFNQSSEEKRHGSLCATVHSMAELRSFFESLD
jgi:FMN phosphatase YigB (HAD superfamily)